MNSPAEVIRQALVNQSLGVMPSTTQGDDWPAFVGHLPQTPDNAFCVYDTSGRRDGRLMSTGENIDHQGWQIRVRAKDHQTAYAKIKAIVDYLSTIWRSEVDIGSSSFMIHAVSKTGTVIAIGQEQDARRRCEFTLNGTITLSIVTP